MWVFCSVEFDLVKYIRHTPPTHRHRPGCWGGGGSSCVWRLPWRAGSAGRFLGRPRTQTRTLALHSSRKTRPLQGYEDGTWDCKANAQCTSQAWIEDYKFRIKKVSTGHTFYWHWVNTCQNSFLRKGPQQWCSLCLRRPHRGQSMRLRDWHPWEMVVDVININIKKKKAHKSRS